MAKAAAVAVAVYEEAMGEGGLVLVWAVQALCAGEVALGGRSRPTLASTNLSSTG